MRPKWKFPIYFALVCYIVLTINIFVSRIPKKLDKVCKDRFSDTRESQSETNDHVFSHQKFLAKYTSLETHFLTKKFVEIHREKRLSSDTTLTLRTPLITTKRCLKKYTLLVMVHSHPENFKRRMIIRQTWGRKWYNETEVPPFKTVFQLGQSRNITVQNETNVEAVKYQDMIFGQFYDTFYKLPIKAIMGFEWATKFCDFEYLLKTDDDVFVDVRNTFKFLSVPDIPKNRLYAGRVHFQSPPVRFTEDEREKKYIVTTEEYGYRSFQRFCFGGGILLSRDFVSDLVNVHDNNNYFKLDDVYIGMLALKLGVDAHHEKMFRLGVSDCKCERGVILRHGDHSIDCMEKLQRCADCMAKNQTCEGPQGAYCVAKNQTCEVSQGYRNEAVNTLYITFLYIVYLTFII